MLNLALFCLSVAFVSAQIAPPTIEELDVPLYLGRWYQTHASPIVYETFEKDGFCVTATYGLYNESTLTVYNHMRVLTPDGEVDEINGFAYTTDDPAKLLVNFGDSDSGGAPYWIMRLGPVAEYDGVELYSYSLVSSPTGLFLFVLVRDVTEFRAEYEEEVLEWLYNNGFNNQRNNPIETYHEEDCLYPE